MTTAGTKRRRAVPVAGRRDRPTTGLRFRGRRPGGRQHARRTSSPLALARGMFGAGGHKSKPRKRSRRGPALLAVLGGLGVAGAALKRRQSARDQPQAPSTVPDAVQSA